MKLKVLLRLSIWLFAILIIAGMPFLANALPLTFTGSFDTSSTLSAGPEGIAFDPASGNLIMGASKNFGGVSGTSTIVEVTTAGAFINSFGVPLGSVEGLGILPNGNLLLSNSVSGGSGGGLFEYTRGGVAVGGGINLTIDPPSGDPDGAVLHTGSNTLFVTDDVDEKIYEFDLAGTLLSSIDTQAILAAFDEPEGIDFDPITGNLLVVDDSGGTRSLYELTTAGALIDVHNLEILTAGAVTPLGPFSDPEGAAFDPATRNLYVAFDNDAAVGIFNLTAPVTTVPEPTSMLLLGAGLVALGLWRRMRR